ncbi:hypothetical protein B0H10DRAFT_2077828, partial [Mycena sp. CBHHK59/15]
MLCILFFGSSLVLPLGCPEAAHCLSFLAHGGWSMAADGGRAEEVCLASGSLSGSHVSGARGRSRAGCGPCAPCARRTPRDARRRRSAGTRRAGSVSCGMRGRLHRRTFRVRLMPLVGSCLDMPQQPRETIASMARLIRIASPRLARCIRRGAAGARYASRWTSGQALRRVHVP